MSCGSTSFRSSDPVDTACTSVFGWPSDIRLVWPRAIEEHNADPENKSAAGYMRAYIESVAQVFEIEDPVATKIFQDYAAYWEALEVDLILNGGRMPPNARSNSKIADLMRYCDSLGKGQKE
jgi:hypothetical protein